MHVFLYSFLCVVVNGMNENIVGVRKRMRRVERK